MSEFTLKLADGTIIGKDGSVLESGSGAGVAAASASTAKPGRARVVSSSGDDVPQDEGSREIATPLVAAGSKRLSDLPDTPKLMNALAVILSYELFGLPDDEIASAVGVSTTRVAELRDHAAYTSLRKSVVGNILSSEQNDVRDVFIQYSRDAARTLLGGLEAKKHGDRLAAANSILDRGGFRPADVVEHRHKLEGGLTIEIVRKDETKSVPTIDMEL